MGKLNVVVLRYLSRDDFRVLTAVSNTTFVLCSGADLLACGMLKFFMTSEICTGQQRKLLAL